MRSPSRPAAADRRRPGTILAALSFAVAIALAPFALNPEANAEVPSDDPQVQGILEQDENLDYLGTPVTSQIPSQAGYGVEDGRHVSYQVFKGAPDSDYPATFRSRT